jgi:hypothetical protein
MLKRPKRELPKSWLRSNILTRIKNRWRNLNLLRRDRMLHRVGVDTKARKKEYSRLGNGEEVEVIETITFIQLD